MECWHAIKIVGVNNFPSRDWQKSDQTVRFHTSFFSPLNMLRAVTFRYWSPLTAQLIRPARSVSTVPSIFRHFTTTTRYCYAAKGKEEPEDSFFTPEERAKYAAINEWREKFTKEKIPYRTFNITYMRSSGPGGQNVNKGKSMQWDECAKLVD
jgi:hypothetical protein